MMPRTDGLELCRTIKSRFEYCHIPVILLTAKSAEENTAAMRLYDRLGFSNDGVRRVWHHAAP